MMRPNQEPIFFDIETTGLYPNRSKLITIQIRKGEKNTVWKEWELGEEGVINEFFNFTENITRKNVKLVGFNNLEFDLPFLNGRLYELKLKNHDALWERFNRHLAFIDLRQLLGDSFGKFAKWKLGFTGDSFDIANDTIPRLYEKGEYSKIVEYIEDELVHFHMIFNAIQHEPFYQELQKLRDKLL